MTFLAVAIPGLIIAIVLTSGFAGAWIAIYFTQEKSMALDTARLETALNNLSTHVDALTAAVAGQASAGQPVIDAAALSVEAADAKVIAATPAT